MLLALRLGRVPALPGQSGGVKGGAVALSLVRLDAQGRLLEPVRFAPGDRFKLLVTCPPALQGPVRVLIFQAEAVYEPLPPQALRCGNRVALPGAFRLDGSRPVQVCAVLGGARGSGIRAAEELRALGLEHACVTLNPQ